MKSDEKKTGVILKYFRHLEQKRKGLLPVDKAAEEIGITEDEFLKLMKKEKTT